MTQSHKKGFTLIEVIVVIVILAVLLAVAIPAVLSYIDTADEASALTECHAIVTAAQKRAIQKYSEDKSTFVSLDQNDCEWIQDFVDVDGQIQGTIRVTQNEVTRLLYQASNGLYVLFDRAKDPVYSIVTEDEINNTSLGQLDQMLYDYIELTKKIAIQQGVSYSREQIANEIINQNGTLMKVNENIQKQSGSDKDLYWRPYYLGKADNPDMILYANSDNVKGTKWDSKLIYINGNIYKSSGNVASFFRYSTTSELEDYLKSQPDTYQLMNLNEQY